jgi:predicted transcriptional regulator
MTDTAKPLVLGTLELEVLEYLWSNAEAHAKAVHSHMKDTRQNSLNTVQSTLDRLYKKGILARRKVAHSFLYTPTHSRTELLARRISDLAVELAGGETKAVLAAFVEFTSRLDKSQIGELEAMIASHKKKTGAKP